MILTEVGLCLFLAFLLSSLWVSLSSSFMCCGVVESLVFSNLGAVVISR